MIGLPVVYAAWCPLILRRARLWGESMCAEEGKRRLGDGIEIVRQIQRERSLRLAIVLTGG